MPRLISMQGGVTNNTLRVAKTKSVTGRGWQETVLELRQGKMMSR